MKLDPEFIQLPIILNTERLMEEVAQFTERDWMEHPQKFAGNKALIFISHKGQMNNDYDGSMAETPLLKRCPYIRQILDYFDTVWGRSRLMLLEPNSEVPEHRDTHYSWRKRIRMHIPIVTDPEVIFSSIGVCDIHMKAGEAWIFDNWKPHKVTNKSNVHRVHLVADTSGSSAFWQQVKRGWSPSNSEPKTDWLQRCDVLNYESDEQYQQSLALKVESYNKVMVRSPNDIDYMLDDLISEMNPNNLDATQYSTLVELIEAFKINWRNLWGQYGDSLDGVDLYNQLVSALLNQSQELLGDCLIEPNLTYTELVMQWLSAIQVDYNEVEKHHKLLRLGRAANLDIGQNIFDRPIFIVAAPRSGSTLLFELLQHNINLWTIGGESHGEFESIPQLSIENHQFNSNNLDEGDYSEDIAIELLQSFIQKLCNADGQLYLDLSLEQRPNTFRFLEKTPKNALRIAFLNSIFPNALFIYLHREAKQNIGSIIDAWHSGHFITYPRLPGRQDKPWSLLLPEGWREMNDKPIADIAAWQWQQANQSIVRELNKLDQSRVCSVDYQDLLDNRADVLQRLCEFSEIPYGPRMQQLVQQPMALSKYTLTQPSAEKWKRHEQDINRLYPSLIETVNLIKSLGF